MPDKKGAHLSFGAVALTVEAFLELVAGFSQQLIVPNDGLRVQDQGFLSHDLPPEFGRAAVEAPDLTGFRQAGAYAGHEPPQVYGPRK
jgi:hypothetical protein